MPTIQCLDPHVADLIAAGEVVERPASVAKELLENALDAGASAVSVEVQHGGLTYLRITDNGCGIAPSQLPTAFLRHATSKLRRAEDLSAIGTLGFRGEALAAIAAVSRVDIFSRERGAEQGASLHLEGGAAGSVAEAGCPEGTTICVRDLFYNTPARMKFMKKDTAEGAAVTAVVTHLALSHPEVSVKLIRDGAEVLHTPGDGQLRSAIYAAMGRDFAMGLLPVSGCGGDIQVEGFVTKPLNGSGTRGRQLFFVNGRFVKSQLLAAALEEAYRNRLLKGKFPGCVLHITLPKNTVDVNVHPAKTVVKFQNERAVFDGKFTFAGYGDALQIFQPRKRVIIDHGNVCGKTRDLFDGRQIERIRADAEIDAQIICKGQVFERTLFQRVFRDPVHFQSAEFCGNGRFGRALFRTDHVHVSVFDLKNEPVFGIGAVFRSVPSASAAGGESGGHTQQDQSKNGRK